MKIIRKINAFGLRLGEQTVEPELTYVINPCVIKYESAWYNPMTGEAVLVEDLKKDMKQLIQKWFYVPKGLDIKSIAHWVRQKTLNGSTGPGSALKTSYTIFTTTSCNASCNYCFEKNYKNISMSDQVAEDVAKYIVKTRNASTTLTIKWFGGEPLVNMRAIDVISEHLNRNLIPFRSSITTNGDLLDKVTDSTIVNTWKLKEVQLTLDDVGSEYGVFKGLDSGAYDRLKKQIIRLSDLGVHISVRIHFHPERGLEPCFRVVDDLKDIQNVSMYGRIIYNSDSIENYNKLLELEEYIKKYGKYTYPFPNRGSGIHCMADNRHISCITPLGELSPCEHYPYGEVYGSIYDDVTDPEMLAEWRIKEKHLSTDCDTCQLYPLCEKLTMCPAEGKCSDGYQYFQIETIKRALRKKVEEVNDN